MKTKPNATLIAADIMRRLPDMRQDSQINNEILIAGIIQEVLDAAAEESDANDGVYCLAFIGLIGLCMFIIIGLIMAVEDFIK